MKKLTAIILAFAAFSSAACNTVQGIGKDIEKGGEAIQRSAK
jgi:predicted small secreted protein